MPRGGSREGAGRKPGSVNRKTREIAEKAIAEGVTPLEVMVQAMREAFKTGGALAAFQYAEKVAPFMHPRLQAVSARVRSDPLEDLSPPQLDALLGALDAFDQPESEDGARQPHPGKPLGSAH